MLLPPSRVKSPLGVCIHIRHLYQLYFIDLNIFISLFQTFKRVDLSTENCKIWKTLLKNRKLKIKIKTRYVRDDKSYLSTVYCFTSLAGKTICKPDRVKVTLHPSGGNIICVEKKTDVPVGVSQYSNSKDLDCQYLYIEFKPTDSNQTVREIFYSVKTIQFNPQYSLPDHNHYSTPHIYREYESKGDRPPIDHTLHFYLDIRRDDMHTTYNQCNITGCYCNQFFAQPQIQHPQAPIKRTF